MVFLSRVLAISLERATLPTTVHWQGGGKTVKVNFDPSKAPYLHSDASFAKKMKVEASVSIFDGPADDDKFVT